MSKTVRSTLNPREPLPAGRAKALAEIASRPDSEIDFSEIPPLDEKFWKNAIRNPFYKPVKRQLTVRLDADVVAWLQSKGAGYQTRMNGMLRQAMLAEARKPQH